MTSSTKQAVEQLRHDAADALNSANQGSETDLLQNPFQTRANALPAGPAHSKRSNDGWQVLLLLLLLLVLLLMWPFVSERSNVYI